MNRLLHFFLVVLLGASAASGQEPPPYQDKSLPAEARTEDLLNRLTPEEKLVMLGGTGFTTQAIARLGVPAFRMADGPVGVRNYGNSTAYAAGVCLAATWDQELAQRVGASIGNDCRAHGAHIILAPGMNLYRAPMGGRNFEYLGEDPVLAGKLAAAYIRGVQSKGVAATAKHFVANNQEFARTALSSDVDERTLRELYLRTFEIAVREGQPACVMTSYNPVNGVHMSQNDALVNGVLKKEWGFRGFVMSDWVSCYDAVAMALGGLDLEMPNARLYQPAKMTELVASGKIPHAGIDDKVRRQLRVGFQMGWFDRAQEDSSIPKNDPRSAAVALEEARAGITLLKNDASLLPLDQAKAHTIALVGPNSGRAVSGGGGSSYVWPFHAVGIREGLRKALGDGSVVTPEWKAGEQPSADAIAQIKAADLAIVCVGFDSPGAYSEHKNDPPNTEKERTDRRYDLPPGSTEMIRAAAEANPRTLVVLYGGGSVETASWVDRVPGLLHAYYPGQEGGTALAEIIVGVTNPSGKLPFSWEKRWEDSAAYGNYPTDANPKANTYQEGLFLGYRWFDAKGVAPLFPFGSGLSYTTFELTDLKLVSDAADVAVMVDVHNTGSRAGAETVEIYVGAPTGGLPRPPRELKAYGKVALGAGETKSVTLKFRAADLAQWEPATRAWVPAKGRYTVFAGDSSRNLPLHAEVAF